MENRKLFRLLFVLCCIATLASLSPAAFGQGRNSATRYVTGTVVGVGGRASGRTQAFNLIINRTTSAEEVQRLTSALQNGQDDLLKTISGMEAGRITIGNGVGVRANVITETPVEGGRKITVIYERNVNFYEMRYGTRSQDYKFGYAELFLGGRDGNQGTFISAAKIRLRDGNIWEVEDFGAFPARLLGLQQRGGNVRR
jgi:hypothetical protein